MPEALVTCPVCLIPNFTPRGLKAHKCKGGNRRNPETGLVEVVAAAKRESPLTLRAREIRAARSTQLPAATPAEPLTQKRPGKQRNLTLPDALHSPCIDVSGIRIADTLSASPALLSPVAEINAFHRRATASAEQARQSAAESCHYAVLCGVRLEQLKASTAHGDWGKLFSNASRRLTSNATQIGKCVAFDFSDKTADRYMEVAKRIRLEKRLSSKAVKRLGAIAEAADVDDKSRAWLNKLTEGQNLRQLYLNLEIVAKPATAAKDKPAATRPPKSDEQLRIEDAREACFLWQEHWTKLVKRGHLDDLPQPELLVLREFLATCRDATKSRLAKP